MRLVNKGYSLLFVLYTIISGIGYFIYRYEIIYLGQQLLGSKTVSYFLTFFGWSMFFPGIVDDFQINAILTGYILLLLVGALFVVPLSIKKRKKWTFFLLAPVHEEKYQAHFPRDWSSGIKERLEELPKLKENRDRKRTEAQESTQERNLVLSEMDRFFTDLLTIAPIAVKDRPELMELLGVVVPS